MNAMKIAQQTAEKAFEQHLQATRCTATQYVPEHVSAAAKAAFEDAGGRGEIVVCGHGNTTHPVCSVEVKRIKRR